MSLTDAKDDDFVAMEAIRVKGDAKAYIQFVTEKNYRTQFAFYLNAYPETPEEDREDTFRRAYKKFQEYDKAQWNAERKPMQDYLEVGSLTIEWAHKVYEDIDRPVTHLEFKKMFATIDVTGDKRLSLLEYLMNKNGKSIEDIASRAQVANPAIQRAQQEVDAATKAIADLEARMTELKVLAAAGDGVKSLSAGSELEQLRTKNQMNMNANLAHAQKALREALRQNSGAHGLAWVAARIETDKIIPLKNTGKV